jgi:outer membrane immunogenic protein
VERRPALIARRGPCPAGSRRTTRSTWAGPGFISGSTLAAESPTIEAISPWPGLLPVASVNNYLAGAVGGGQAGFNWQYGLTVLGAEADIQASGVKGGIATPCIAGLCAAPVTASYNQSVPWFGTVRGRLGAAWSGWMIYAAGGYAYGRIETDAVAAAGPAVAVFSLHETRNGWTAGSGIEVAFAPGWSAKLEYLYLDFGHRSSTLGFVPLPVTDGAHLAMNVVRAGVNYRF